MNFNIAIVGSNGAIGSAIVDEIIDRYPDATIHLISRKKVRIAKKNCAHHVVDYHSEASIKAVALAASKEDRFDMVFVATGMLHADNIMPEKSIKDLSVEKFERLFYVNTVLPSMIAKYFLPRLKNTTRSVFAVLSARVGSISDNRLGGWYAYRASKAALNMIIKTAAIEVKRTNKYAIVAGIHPGTVISALSEPFQGNVPEKKLFTAEISAKHIVDVLNQLTGKSSGKCFAWDGQEIAP